MPVMPPQTARIAARFSQFGIAAARMARSDSRLDTARHSARASRSHRHIDQVMQTEATHAAHARATCVAMGDKRIPAHAATSHVSTLASRPDNDVFDCMCGGPRRASGWAQLEIRRGHASAVIAGGTETSRSRILPHVFHAAVPVSWQGPPDEAKPPFDQWRSGKFSQRVLRWS